MARLLNKKFLSTLSVILFFVLWESIGRQINPVFISFPTKIATALYEITLISYELPRALWISLLEFMVGFGISLPLGIGIGLLMGHSRIVNYLLDPFVNAIYATPRIVFIPVIILWFGLGFQAKVFFIILLAVFPVLINTYAGVRNTDSSYVELARSFKATKFQTMKKITLPASIPYVIAGVRLSAGMAIIGVILAEMFTAMTGLGALLINYGNRFQTDKLFAVIIVIGVLAVALNTLIGRIEKQLSYSR